VAVPTALLLDIDGTLVDNTAQHIAAWQEAFRRLGLGVARDVVRRHVGMGGDHFVRAVASEAWDRAHGDACRRQHRQGYRARMAQVRPVAYAREFLAAVRESGHHIVLATSSDLEEVAANLKVLAEDPAHFVIVDSDDVHASKPAPDIFTAALARSGRSASEAVAIGDTRWDGESAGQSGIAFWGVLTGSGTTAELRQGGAAQVFPDLKALLLHLQA
jgi:HAD superfamily hydrolase (TIGR01509 family)